MAIAFVYLISYYLKGHLAFQRHSLLDKDTQYVSASKKERSRVLQHSAAHPQETQLDDDDAIYKFLGESMTNSLLSLSFNWLLRPNKSADQLIDAVHGRKEGGWVIE